MCGVLSMCVPVVCVRRTTAWRRTRLAYGKATRHQICTSCCSSRCRACRACCWGRGSSHWGRPRQSAHWCPTQQHPQRCGRLRCYTCCSLQFPSPLAMAGKGAGCQLRWRPSTVTHDATCLKAAHQPPGVPSLLCPGSGWDAVLRRAWRPLHPSCGCAALRAMCLTTAGTVESNCTLLLPFSSTAWCVG